jgi:hypothetical protein
MRESISRQCFWKNGERWLLVLDAFVDEAGTNKQCPCVTVAGFYGNRDQWRMFRESWKPKSVGFHALRHEERFPALCSAIEASQVSGIWVTLWKKDYEKLATEHMKSFMGNPYAICAFMCVMEICEQVKTPTAIVLEQGQPNFPFVRRMLEQMMDSGQLCISSVTPAMKKDFIELHPADFAAHCGSTYDKPPLKRLMDAGRLLHGHITREMLEGIAPQLTAMVKRARNERLKGKRKS